MNSKNNKISKAVTGGTWLLLSSTTNILTGLIFWFFLTRVIGAGGIGRASAIVSSAGIAATILSAGLSLATIRVVASRGLSGVLGSIVSSIILGIIASFLSFLLSLELHFGFTYYAALMAFLSVTSLVISQSIIGLERFRDYFKLVFACNAVKLLTGLGLAGIGLGSLAAILGYLSFPITSLIIGLIILLTLTNQIHRIHINGLIDNIKETLKLMLANYPQGLSSQLLISLGVYIFALITKKAIDTGILYVSLMAVLALAAVPGSVLTALLPSGSRGEVSSMLYKESLRIGLGLITPLIITFLMIPGKILSLINPSMSEGGKILFILTLSIVPFASVQAGIIVLNARRNLKMITSVGIIRLLSLMISLLIFVPTYGSIGAAISFLIANILPLPLSLKPIPSATLTTAELWLIQVGLWSIGFAIEPFLGLGGSLGLTVMLSVVLLHITNILKINEIADILKMVISVFNKGDYS